MSYKEIQEACIQKYRVTLDEHSSCRARMHAHIRERRICKWHPKNSLRSTFDLLHEIGHIETTKRKMRRCEAEFYATQWALDRCKEYGLQVPQSIINVYQRYIFMERDRGERRGCRTLPPITALRLNI